MKRLKWVSGFSAVLAMLSLLATASVQAEIAPDVLVKTIASDVTTVLKTDPAVLSNPAKLRDLIESKLIPNFNFVRMTQLAMGRNWAKASPEQQTALSKEFQTLLVRTYSGALASFRNNTIDTRPLRMAAADTDVTVKTVINQPNGQGIPIDYSLEKVADGNWKAYDIVVAGVSLVTNYREEFNAVIRDQGVDALIKQLQSKNK
jgi:phospholipid transport system substrate-binding protein